MGKSHESPRRTDAPHVEACRRETRRAGPNSRQRSRHRRLDRPRHRRAPASHRRVEGGRRQTAEQLPLFYRVDRGLITTEGKIDAVAAETSGEVETVIFSAGGLWVALGSDHTDRAAEAYSVALSKQLCRKVVAAELWRFDDVEPHWDWLTLRAHVVVGGKRRL
jgi:uncharacterized protein DUF2848